MAAAALLDAKREPQRKTKRERRDERSDLKRRDERSEWARLDEREAWERGSERGGETDEDRRTPRFAVWTVVALLLLGMAGALYLFPEFQRLPQTAFRVVAQHVDRMVAADKPPQGAPPQPVTPQPAAPRPATPEPAIQPEAPAPYAKSIENAAPIDSVQPPAPNALSVPLENVTLRNTPELLEQLVSVYRSKLVDDPNNTAALDALARLREQSLAELEAISAEDISAEKDAVRSATSLEVASRLFPELLENARYHVVAERLQQALRKITETVSPSPANARVSAPAESSSVVPAAPKEKAIPSKPDIRVLSVTPGRMTATQFVPEEGGNVFMVVMSYRNFARASDAESETELVVRVGNAGDQQVLAEVPVEMHGDRGTKSVPIETFVSGYAGEVYKLNFILNGEFLASRRVRLSAP